MHDHFFAHIKKWDKWTHSGKRVCKKISSEKSGTSGRLMGKGRVKISLSEQGIKGNKVRYNKRF